MDQPNLRDRPIPRADRFETIGLAALYPGRVSIRPTSPVHAYRLEGVLTDQADMEARARDFEAGIKAGLEIAAQLARKLGETLHEQAVQAPGVTEQLFQCSADTASQIADAIEALGEAKG